MQRSSSPSRPIVATQRPQPSSAMTRPNVAIQPNRTPTVSRPKPPSVTIQRQSAERGILASKPATLTPRPSVSLARPASREFNPEVQQAITARRNEILAKIDSLLPGGGSLLAGKQSSIQMPKLPWVDVPLPGATAAAQSGSGDVYWVSFSRSDSPRTYELYSAYQTKAEADKAAQEISNWAARTNWKVADIQIEKDAGSKSTTASDAGSQDGKRVSYADMPAKNGATAKGNGWLAKAYNPPPLTFSASPAQLAAPVAPTPPAALTDAPSAPVARAQSWAAQRRNELEREVSNLKIKGVLRTVQEVIAYRRDGLRTIGKTVAGFNELVNKTKSFQEKVEKVLDFVAGESKDPPHPAWQGAREMAKVGIETQEKAIVVTGIPEFDELLKGVIKGLKNLLKSPKSLAEDKAKEGIERLLTP